MAQELITSGNQFLERLPASWRSLYRLALIKRDDPDRLEQAGARYTLGDVSGRPWIPNGCQMDIARASVNVCRLGMYLRITERRNRDGSRSPTTRSQKASGTQTQGVHSPDQTERAAGRAWQAACHHNARSRHAGERGSHGDDSGRAATGRRGR
jgi:hypothetical protein